MTIRNSGGGGLEGYEYVRNGGARSMRTCVYRGGNQSFVSFWCVRTN